MFGFPRLRELVDEYGDGSSLVERLLNELFGFVGADLEQEDDITLVVLQMLRRQVVEAARNGARLRSEHALRLHYADSYPTRRLTAQCNKRRFIMFTTLADKSPATSGEGRKEEAASRTPSPGGRSFEVLPSSRFYAVLPWNSSCCQS